MTIKKITLLKILVLQVNKNDFVCFVGESGVGKSTLIDLLTGILIPTKGNIYVDSINIKNILPKYQNIIGIVPQKTRLINDSLLSNIILESDEKLKNEKRFNDAIKFAQLEKTVKKIKMEFNIVWVKTALPYQVDKVRE